MRNSRSRWWVCAALALGASFIQAVTPSIAPAADKSSVGRQGKAAADPPPICSLGVAGRHDTLVDWMASPEDAASRAAIAGKLVFVMQISGNFAREEFT